MQRHEPDIFRLGGYTSEGPDVEQRWEYVVLDEDEFTVLAEHHTDNDEQSFYVLHNDAVIPGDPQIVALHLQRDPATRTFRFEDKDLPLPAMAQSWLIARGCPKEAIDLQDGTGTRPADAATRLLEERLMSDGDHFALLHSYTDDTADRPEIVVLLRALDEREPWPFRILLREADLDAGTHTLREGGFSTFKAATDWFRGHFAGVGAPLPTAPPPARHNPVAAAPARPAPAVPPRGRSR
ncbi:hypothetical protein ACH4PU_35355 [Streptomyces sp. NPDC021100]|uniref:hypothetical protein n=1 Tax=Streptomyces sp. NPDC021100 TaxID=3365114 RepID=UPI0037AE8266